MQYNFQNVKALRNHSGQIKQQYFLQMEYAAMRESEF